MPASVRSTQNESSLIVLSHLLSATVPNTWVCHCRLQLFVCPHGYVVLRARSAVGRLISPYKVDLECRGGSWKENQAYDYLIKPDETFHCPKVTPCESQLFHDNPLKNGLREQMYAGTQPLDHPLISPINASLVGLPPLLIQGMTFSEGQPSSFLWLDQCTSLQLARWRCFETKQSYWRRRQGEMAFRSSWRSMPTWCLVFSPVLETDVLTTYPVGTRIPGFRQPRRQITRSHRLGCCLHPHAHRACTYGPARFFLRPCRQ